MNHTNAFLLFLLAFGSLLLTNCASLTGFETGRTSGQGNGFFSVSFNATRTPEFDLGGSDSISNSFFFPNLEGGLRYGVIERLDLGIKANSNFNIMVDGKYQVLGDKESEAALSLGAGIGTFGAFVNLWNVQIPAYFSFHPSENFAFYVNPRYVYQFNTGDLGGGLKYLGGNTGILFGKKNKFGLDVGLYNLKATGNIDVVSLLTFGVGGQFTF